MASVSPTTIPAYWWEKDKPHQEIFAIIRHLDHTQKGIEQSNIRNLRLYGNFNVLGLSAYTYAQNQPFQNPADRVSLNIIQSCCDTATNKIAKNKPRPMFLTSGGDAKMQKKAKRLTKFVDGCFYGLNLYPKGQEVFRDGTILGTGLIHFYREGKEMYAERVFADELKVDLNECLYGNPRSLYRTKHLSREVVKRMFPGFDAEIEQAKDSDSVAPQFKGLAKNILVVESWHLPSKKGAKDGKHVICVDSVTLREEAWEYDVFPFQEMRWAKPVLGYWGRGIAEELTGLQVEVNKILRTIQVSFHLLGVPWVLIDSSSNVVKAHINNDIAHGVAYDGIKPEVYTPQPVNPQLFQHLDRLVERAYQQCGISQLSAQAKKPEGLDSGKALREFNDIEADRFITIGQAYEDFYLGCARHVIRLAKEIYAEDKDFSVKAKGKKGFEEIKWSEVNLEDDQYIMQMFPVSSLSNTPSGRLKDIQEFVQAGFIPQEFATKLLDFPDLEEFLSLANAAIEDIEWMIEKMVDEGEEQTPEPYQNLQLGIKMAQSAYLRGKRSNVPEERLELLRNWMNEADRLLGAANPQPNPNGVPGAAPMPGGAGGGMPAPGGAPIAQPAAPPVSDMMRIGA